MRKFTLSTKLYLGFGLVLLLLALTAGNAIYSVGSLAAAGKESQQTSEYMLFMQGKELDHLKWLGSVKNLFLENQPTLDVQLDPHKCGLGRFLFGPEAEKMSAQFPEIGRLLKEIKGPHARLHESAAAIKDVWRQNHPGLRQELADRLDDHRRWAAALGAAILQNKTAKVATDPTQCLLGKWLATARVQKLRRDWPEFAEILDELIPYHDKLHQSAAEINAAPDNAQKTRIYLQKTEKNLGLVAGLIEKAVALEGGLNAGQAKALDVFTGQTLPALHATQAKLRDIGKRLGQEQQAAQKYMTSSAQQAEWIAAAVALAGIALGILLSFSLSRAITKPIQRVADGLTGGAGQVAAASQQVASSSQSLAEGASEQAASLEEASASLEEMSSMTRQNADHAGQADSLMKETSSVVDRANASMKQVRSAMEDITSASDETAKIIKTIDEIAFQTNLLALNAAVEAARAGEAGAGFAVVADEVRNLAMRAAEAAKNTQTLIERNIGNIKAGTELVVETDEAFSDVATNANKVGELVGEIAAASSEQAQGLSQINIATSEMDKVTQRVAANAEESAAASEELAGQADSMQDLVEELMALVASHNGSQASGRISSSARRKALPAPAAQNKGNASAQHQDQAPPQGDDEFSDF